MPRSEQDIRRELALWREELDRHLAECSLCSEEEYCPRGAKIDDIVGQLSTELVALYRPGLKEEARRKFLELMSRTHDLDEATRKARAWALQLADEVADEIAAAWEKSAKTK